MSAVGPFPVLIAYELCFGPPATGRQLIIPARLQGRVNAFPQAVLTGTMPVGALVGDALARGTLA